MAFNSIGSVQDEITLMKFETMSMPKDDDSPQQQINEQSLAQDLEKNRECKSNDMRDNDRRVGSGA